MNVARRPLVFSCVLALLSGLLLAHVFRCGLSCPGGGGGNSTVLGSGGELEATAEAFEIGGVPSSRTIAPGVMVPVDLKFTNPYDSGMDVRDLTVTVDAVDAPNATSLRPCSKDDFIVKQAAGNLPIKIAAGRTSALSNLHLLSERWPRVGMLDRSANQDGCKAAMLYLTYSATGETGN